jgi:hypothetical protein
LVLVLVCFVYRCLVRNFARKPNTNTNIGGCDLLVIGFLTLEIILSQTANQWEFDEQKFSTNDPEISESALCFALITGVVLGLLW